MSFSNVNEIKKPNVNDCQIIVLPALVKDNVEKPIKGFVK
jgi:hypothetical protein